MGNPSKYSNRGGYCITLHKTYAEVIEASDISSWPRIAKIPSIALYKTFKSCKTRRNKVFISSKYFIIRYRKMVNHVRVRTAVRDCTTARSHFGRVSCLSGYMCAPLAVNSTDRNARRNTCLQDIAFLLQTRPRWDRYNVLYGCSNT